MVSGFPRSPDFQMLIEPPVDLVLIGRQLVLGEKRQRRGDEHKESRLEVSE